MLKGLRIRICDHTDINDHFLTKLSSMINQVFLVAEAEIWNDNHQRISNKNITYLINKGEIMVAELNNELAACVWIKLLNPQIAKFGMLTVAPLHKGKKLGSLMVNEVEKYALAKGRIKMRLELLMPKDTAHPGKKFLLNWYTRIGYHFLEKLEFEEVEPKETDNLRIPCFFNLYEKDLLLKETRPS